MDNIILISPFIAGDSAANILHHSTLAAEVLLRGYVETALHEAVEAASASAAARVYAATDIPPSDTRYNSVIAAAMAASAEVEKLYTTGDD